MTSYGIFHRKSYRIKSCQEEENNDKFRQTIEQSLHCEDRNYIQAIQSFCTVFLDSSFARSAICVAISRATEAGGSQLSHLPPHSIATGTLLSNYYLSIYYFRRHLLIGCPIMISIPVGDICLLGRTFSARKSF